MGGSAAGVRVGLGKGLRASWVVRVRNLAPSLHPCSGHKSISLLLLDSPPLFPTLPHPTPPRPFPTPPSPAAPNRKVEDGCEMALQLEEDKMLILRLVQQQVGGENGCPWLSSRGG